MAPKVLHPKAAAGKGRGKGKGKMGIGKGGAAVPAVAIPGPPPLIVHGAAGGVALPPPPAGGAGAAVPGIRWSHLQTATVVHGSCHSTGPAPLRVLYDWGIEAAAIQSAIGAVTAPGAPPVQVVFRHPEVQWCNGPGKGAGKHPMLHTPFRVIATSDAICTQVVDGNPIVRILDVEVISGADAISIDIR